MITNAMIESVKEFLGEEGILFFKGLQDNYGEVSPVINTGGIPHSVHFNEGMQIRNHLRESGLCDSWDCHGLDDNWTKIVEEIIK